MRTDHQALVALFSAGPEGCCPLRISRWCSKLMYYNFNVRYCKGANNVIADALSHLPLQLLLAEERDEKIISLVASWITKAELQAATTAHLTLSQVLTYVHEGWPSKSALSAEFLTHFSVRKEQSCVDDLLFRDEQVIPRLISDTSWFNLPTSCILALFAL